MRYVVIVHHEHVYHNAAMEGVFGPFELLDTAKATLVDLAAAWNKGRTLEEDGLFWLHDDGTYLGGDDEKNPESVIGSDIWCEVWAEIEELREPSSMLS